MSWKPTFIKVFKKKKRENYCLIKNVINRNTCVHVQIRILQFPQKNPLFDLNSFGDLILERFNIM